MYRIAVCDDNECYLEKIEDRIKDYEKRNEKHFDVYKFIDSDILMEKIEAFNLFDVYFLDIEMPCYTGIDLAEKIKKVSDTAMIVFITAYDSFAVKACGFNVVKYLMKEHIDEQMDDILDEILERLRAISDDKMYVILNQRRYIRLQQRDIIYAYKYQKNTVFVLRNGQEERERLSLQKAYEKMDNEDMIWLDRGIILNIRYICQVTEQKIIMEGGYEIVTSVDHVKELKKILSDYWEKRLW